MDAKAFRGVALIAAGLLAAALTSCGEIERWRIAKVLDARDAAMNARDLSRYAELIAEDYLDEQGRTKPELLADVKRLFAQFDAIEMRSMDRVIRLLGKDRAVVEQSYRLIVRKGESVRTIVQREQLRLRKTAQGWQIVSGL